MAGFFGLFNYEKEGPGIKKNAPKKKTFVVFFETFIRNFWKFMTINLVYLISCIPIITNGLANVGITNITRNISRDKHSFGLSDYFETIKKNWKQALAAGILNIAILLLIAFDAIVFFDTKGWFGIVGQGVIVCMSVIFTVMNYYIWTLMITFKFNIMQIYRNSFKFFFINMKRNIICFFSLLFVNVVLFLLVYFSMQVPMLFSLMILIIILCYPSFRFLLIQFCVFPAIKEYIIDPYYEEHPDEDIEKRKDLGLEVQNDENSDVDEAADFSDSPVNSFQNSEEEGK